MTPDTDLRKLLEMTGHTQSDLARLVGSRSRASEYLSGKRAVPIGERRNLMSQWGISAHDAIMLPTSKAIPIPTEVEA